MRYALLFTTFFAALSVCTPGSGKEPIQVPMVQEPVFWTDMADAETGIYLGQHTRRRNGNGGRVWANFYYGGATLRPLNIPKIQPDFYGLQLGFDAVRTGFYSTYFLNVHKSDAESGSAPVFRSDQIENYHFGLGKFYYLRYCHFGYTASAGYDRYKSVQRSGGNAAGDGDGFQTNLFGEFGLDCLIGQWAFRPFYALQYDFLYHGNIGNAGLLHKDWNGHGLEQLMGMRTDWKITEALTIQFRGTWVRELLSKAPPYYHVRFSPMQGVQTPAIMYFEGDTGRDGVWLGGGIKFEKIFNIFTYLDYDVIMNSRQTTHIGSLGFCLNW